MIDKLRKYLNPVPASLRTSFNATLARENFLRLIPMSIVYILLNTRLSVFGRKQAETELDIRNYMVLFLLLVCILAYYRLRQISDKSKWYDMALIHVFCFIMIFVTLLASQIMLVRIGSMTIFTVTILSTSAFLIRRPSIAIVTNISALIYFTATIDILAHISRRIPSIHTPSPMWASQTARFEIYLTELTLICFISCIISIFVYRFRAKVYMDHKIIEEKNLNLMELTMQDSMTKLLNHKAINDLLAQETRRTQRYDLALSVFLLDIDHFKSVNDKYGHQTGDEVIIQISDILKSACRETDYVGRYGGEEFMIILTNTDCEQAAVFGERVRTVIEKTNFQLPRQITISGGISTYNGESAKDLVHIADQGLYEAKHTGRNKVISMPIANKKIK